MIHRDVKPENILIDSFDWLKLSDFGCSRDFATSFHQNVSFAGTHKYMAPEMIKDHTAGYSKKIDVWSAGIVLYEMATLSYPFDEKNIYNSIINNRINIPDEVPAEVAEIIYLMLEIDPKKRVSF